MADIDYKGHVAIVTGAGHGLGRSHFSGLGGYLDQSPS
jgi:NAD(P)-dependent dehydrogenase (short-subunit alcohol dehydrogenase family)